jgi:acylphosphatase
MPCETVCQHLFITGRVQGVGFRAALASAGGELHCIATA